MVTIQARPQSIRASSRVTHLDREVCKSNFDCKWLIGFYQGNLAKVWTNIIETILQMRKLITFLQLYRIYVTYGFDKQHSNGQNINCIV